MKIGILGGGCFWKSWDLPFEQIKVKTPYGKPSDLICKGTIGRHEIFTLQRHGQSYQLPLQEIPWQANVHALYMQNVDFVIQASACGSYRNDTESGDFALLDQVIDFTSQRPLSLGRHALKGVTYPDFSRPITDELINFTHDVFTRNKIKHKVGGTIIVEEGPRYSTLAESKMFKNFGADFVNHVCMPELYLLRERSIPTLAVSMITNRIDLDDGGKILAKDITDSITKFKNNMPYALLTLIKNLPDSFSFESISTTPYDVSGFELRASTAEARQGRQD